MTYSWIYTTYFDYIYTWLPSIVPLLLFLLHFLFQNSLFSFHAIQEEVDMEEQFFLFYRHMDNISGYTTEGKSLPLHQ